MLVEKKNEMAAWWDFWITHLVHHNMLWIESYLARVVTYLGQVILPFIFLMSPYLQVRHRAPVVHERKERDDSTKESLLHKSWDSHPK
jgi:hypothetical protein